MALSDLDEMLRLCAAERDKDSFSANTEPTQNEVINWLNDAVIDMIRMLSPRRLDNGKWTPGRLDKLIRITETETVADQATANGYVALPSTADAVCHFLGVKIGASGSEVRAKEVSVAEMFERGVAGTAFVATTSNPIYAWANGKLYYRPKINSANIIYYYLTLEPEGTSIAMSEGTAETEIFPLDRDLMIPAVSYVKAQLWAQDARDVESAAYHWKDYLTKMQEIIGDTDKIQVKHVV